MRALRLQDAGVIEDVADYQAIASTAPWLTHLSVELPASATALPQQMSACSRLENLVLRADKQLSYMAPLTVMVNLQSLDISTCYGVSDLAPLSALVNLQRLKMSGRMSV
jgi:hypothetical protein